MNMNLTPHELHQLHIIWNIPPTLAAKLATYKLSRISASALKDSLVHSKDRGTYIIPHKDSSFLVTFHNSSYSTLCYDATSELVHYWVSFRAHGQYKVAILSRDINSLPAKWDSQRLQYWPQGSKATQFSKS